MGTAVEKRMEHARDGAKTLTETLARHGEFEVHDIFMFELGLQLY